MSNKLHYMAEQFQSPSYASSQSGEDFNHEKMRDSLQYLERIRKINQNISTVEKSKDQFSKGKYWLQKLVGLDQQITFIDNDKLFGIVKVERFKELNTKLSELKEQYNCLLSSENKVKAQNQFLKQQISQLGQSRTELKTNLSLAHQNINAERILRLKAEQEILSLSQSLNKLTNQSLIDSQKYLSLQMDFQNYKYSQEPSSKQSTSFMLSQTQTDSFPTTISIPTFNFDIQQILKDLKNQSNQTLSSSNLKEVVLQSLHTFVKQIDSQYNLIKKQTIEVAEFQQKNIQLIQENKQLKQKMQQTSIEEQKLNIFKTCMTSFLQNTSENVAKSIQFDRTKKDLNSQILKYKSQIIVNPQQENEKQNLNNLQFTQLKQNLQYYKKENIHLIKTIGEYQYKWKNVEKVLQENKSQETPDDGTVGQLVKMSKLVKESIKNLLHQL